MGSLKDLRKLGQSPWYDNIQRDMLLSGKLKDLIELDGVTGLTSNPSIFEKAINGSQSYGPDIQRLSQAGKDARAIYDELTTWDIAKAADLLLNVYRNSGKNDGFVSLEVSPELAHDTLGTVAEAKRLYAKVSRANLMIKVPATKAGVEALRQLTSQGISINATLIFSQAHYTAVATAYLRGLEERMAKGLPLKGINSVASLFVSRIDNYVDRLLNDLFLKEQDPNAQKEIQGLVGAAAIAHCKIVYDIYRRIFFGPDFSKFRGQGANMQRLLFGSTSTKNPSYSDVKYVEGIIGEGTVNTLPEVVVEAFKDHGQAKPSLSNGLLGAKEIMTSLYSHGISVDEVCQTIQDDGVEAFISSYKKLLKSLETKRNEFIS